MAHILVVDDSRSTLEAMAMMLEGAGHRVSSCANGKSALRMIGREEFDLMLTDVFMPKEDGLEVIREVRRLGLKLPVVAMSGMVGSLDMLTVARHLGAFQLLQKPFSNTDLLDAVGVALGAPAALEHMTPPSGNTGHRK